jgi:hypothetical protein
MKQAVSEALIGLLFNLKKRGGMILRNVCGLHVVIPRKITTFEASAISDGPSLGTMVCSILRPDVDMLLHNKNELIPSVDKFLKSVVK